MQTALNQGEKRTADARRPNVTGTRTVAIDPVKIDTRRWKAAMYQFQCGHQECFSQYTASNKDALMQQVADHLKEAHNVDKATETLMSYLEATCVTTR
jgi:predicted small metal-binding protein